MMEVHQAISEDVEYRKMQKENYSPPYISRSALQGIYYPHCIARQTIFDLLFIIYWKLRSKGNIGRYVKSLSALLCCNVFIQKDKHYYWRSGMCELPWCIPEWKRSQYISHYCIYFSLFRVGMNCNPVCPIHPHFHFQPALVKFRLYQIAAKVSFTC